MEAAFQKAYPDGSCSASVQRRVTAVILAGGDSSRFGRDKAFALWQGQPFIQLVGAAVRVVSDSVLVLVPAGSKNLEYAKLVPGATIVPDRAAGAGPVDALQGVTVLLRAPFTLVAPCDAPGLPHGLVRRLVAIAEETGRPAVAVPPTGPLFTLFAAPTPLLLERLQRAHRLEDLVAGAEPVPTDAANLNVNEPPR